MAETKKATLDYDDFSLALCTASGCRVRTDAVDYVGGVVAILVLLDYMCKYVLI